MAEGAAADALAESGGDGASGVSASERGVAPIKAQYRTTKEQFHGFLEAKGQEKLHRETEAADPDGNVLAEPQAKRIRLEDGKTEDGWTEHTAEPREQPQAQKRARGQNKGRPHMKPMHYDKNRLCPSLIQEPAAHCFFGDRCRFLHDVDRYLETKPADLGPCCVLFETNGRCPYGVTCRFASAHLGPKGENLVQEELLARQAGAAPSVRNSLDKALQQQLRKRQVCFQKAEQALRQLSQDPVPAAAAIPEVPVAAGAAEQNNCDTPLDPAGLGAGTPPSSPGWTCGPLTDEDVVRLRPCEKKRLDISGKLYLAPLTTCGNLPFRRICKRFGADVTCGEMAVCTNLLQGQMSEWALLKRHQCEDIFGVQLEGAFPDTMTKCAELLNRTIDVDFVDINVGCPIDLVYKKGGGCALMNRTAKFQQIVRGMNQVPAMSPSACLAQPAALPPTHSVPAGAGCAAHCEDPHRCPGACEPGAPPAARAAGLGRRARHGGALGGSGSGSGGPRSHLLTASLPSLLLVCPPSPPVSPTSAHPLARPSWSLSPCFLLCLCPHTPHRPQLHGRSREQRYTRLADWQYIEQCAKAASPMPLFGNGDILSYEDANRAMQTGVSGIMIGRGALLKPWLFTEIKEQRHWDISSSERLDILRDFTHHGLEHWGSDTQGVEKTRRFLLEWLSFLCRYVPVGLLERLPQRINERPPYYLGRDYLETLMASQQAADWIRISEMLLGPVPPNFIFLPKHKANAYK